MSDALLPLIDAALEDAQAGVARKMEALAGARRRSSGPDVSSGGSTSGSASRNGSGSLRGGGASLMGALRSGSQRARASLACAVAATTEWPPADAAAADNDAPRAGRASSGV